MPNRRPQLRIEAPAAASAEEAAAVVAAVERYLRDTAPPLVPEPPRESAWVRAARAEAVEREPGGDRWA
jgi:hypothetical protein